MKLKFFIWLMKVWKIKFVQHIYIDDWYKIEIKHDGVKIIK